MIVLISHVKRHRVKKSHGKDVCYTRLEGEGVRVGEGVGGYLEGGMRVGEFDGCFFERESIE